MVGDGETKHHFLRRRPTATLLLGFIAVVPLVCAETKLGLASFGVTGVQRVGDSLAVGISYDATSAGNPWQGGIYGYGPIEALDRVELDIWYFKEGGLANASLLVNAVQQFKAEGGGFGWVDYLYDNVPELYRMGAVKARQILIFNASSPRSGSFDMVLAIPGGLFRPDTMGTYYAVAIAQISYWAFNGKWANTDGSGAIRLNTETQITASLTCPSLVEQTASRLNLTLKLEGKNVGWISYINWSFQYKGKAGQWQPAWTTKTSRQNLSVQSTTWQQYAIDHGQAKDGGVVVEMRVEAGCYYAPSWDITRLLATSNSCPFSVQIAQPDVTIDGPGYVGSFDEKVSFAPRSKANLAKASRLDWLFSYRNRDGGWVDLAAVTRTGYEALVLTRSTKPSLDEWLELARQHATEDSVLGRYMTMRVVAKVYSVDGLLVATSKTSTFAVYPPAPKLNLTVSGPDKVVSKDGEVVFKVTAVGDGKDLVDKAEWTFTYTDERGEWVWEWQMYLERADLADLKILKTTGTPNLTYLLGLALEMGLPRESVRVLKMKVEIDAYAGETLMGSSNVHSFTVEAEANLTQYRVVALPQKIPLRHITLVFKDGAKTFAATTDSSGYYNLPLRFEAGKKYELDIRWRYAREEKTYFTLCDPDGDEVESYLDVLDGKASMGYLTKDGKEQVTSTDLGPVLWLDSLGTESGPIFVDYSTMYIHFTEALEFYKDYLGQQIAYNLPLKILTFLDDGVEMAYHYEASKVWITIPEKYSRAATPYAPKNREYHEFSHFAMHAIYEGRWPKPPPGPVKEINHDGYVNPTTSDSFVEGFAHFMSMVIAQYYDFWWDSSDRPRLAGVLGSMENDYKAWDSMGWAEELAIAGILWDLYDGESDYKAEQQEFNDMRRTANDAMLQTWDYNKDGVLTKAEAIRRDIETELNWNFDKDGPFRETNLASFLTGLYGLRADTDPEGLAKSLMTADADHDGLLRGDEQVAAAVSWQKLGQSPDDPDRVRTQMLGCDRDSDGALDSQEVSDFIYGAQRAQAEERAKSLMPEYDGDGSGTLDRQDMDRLIDMLLKGWPGATDEPVPIARALADDDGVELDFEEIWGVIGAYHADFTSVYEAFVARHGDKKEEIDEIFKAHGFFADLDRGNGQYDQEEPFRDTDHDKQRDEGEMFVDLARAGPEYDEGERIGPATNYNRTERRSTRYLPGQFVKVDNDVPVYVVEVYYYDGKFAGDVLPSGFDRVSVANENGYVYLPVPPESYNARLIVKPVGVEAETPLMFAAEDFRELYVESVRRGYFVEHNFNVSYQPPTEEPEEEEGGELPPWFVEFFPFLVPLVRPVLPYLPASLISFVPLMVLGLPVLVVLAAVGIVLRKRKSRRNTAPPNAK